MSAVVTKILWMILNPANILVGMQVLATILLFSARRRLAKILLTFTSVIVVIIAFAPLEVLLLEPLQTRFSAPSLPNKVHGVLVLGGALDARETIRRGRVVLNNRAERITAFVELASRYPDAQLVYTGGAEPVSEAEVAGSFVQVLGVPASRLKLETRSRDTYENALFTYALIRPKEGEVWILITSASHMPRAVGAFRKIGWNVIPYPVDYRRLGDGDETFGRNLGRGLNLLNASLREWIGLVHYYLTDRSDRLFPGP
jgi:uncharacterized SAM-binding protein YcdF (DUF218 family)